MVNFKLPSKDWFCYNLIILIKYENEVPKFSQSSIISEKPSYLSEKL